MLWIEVDEVDGVLFAIWFQNGGAFEEQFCSSLIGFHQSLCAETF
jgi:hypothetical protein